MNADGFEIKVRSEEVRGCADQFTTCTILGSLLSLSDEEGVEIDMKNCNLETCTGELCNDDTFTMMSSGAVGVVASVVVMVFSMVFFA